MMSKEELYAFLNGRNISYEITEHIPVFTIEEMLKANLPYPEIIAKNLFVRDDKKQNYYLISVKEDRAINLKDFQEKFMTRRLSFVSENDLINILGVKRGAVTPFAILNDEERKVNFFVGSEFLNGRIGIHPLENTATVWMDTSDLINLIKGHGNIVRSF